MAKRQKLSFYQLDDLPDEVILKVLGFLNIKELLLCGQVSKRLRAIANDESLWLKLNLHQRQVPYDFIEKAAGNGCQYLSLVGCGLTGKSEASFKLKYLNVTKGKKGVQKLVQNCSALQKLSVAGLTLDSDDIQYICQNSKTLQVLDLDGCKFDLHKLKESQIGQTLEDLELEYCNFRTKLIRDLFTNCAHLTELNISVHPKSELLDPHIQALVDNLTSTILKVNLGYQYNLQDEHVKKLVKRCNNITQLYLSDTSITNNSLHSIIEQLKPSLEKLNLSGTKIDFVELSLLKSMPALKTLICDFNPPDNEEEAIENLKQQLRHIIINGDGEDYQQDLFFIASPFKAVKLSKYSGPIHTSQPNSPHGPQMTIDIINYGLTSMPLPGQLQGQPITAQGPPGAPGQQPSGKVILNVEHHFMDNGKLVKKVGCS